MLAEVLNRAAKEFPDRVAYRTTDGVSATFRQLDQLLSLLRCTGEWFFHENMLPILQGSLCQFEMRPDRRNDCNCIDVS